MARIAAFILAAAFSAELLAHPFTYGGREISHFHLSPEMLLVAALVGVLAILRSK
jgi:hypothetical protein